tara:strand:+ start:393 stop:671 length:279 start_codon:yes stop_codon:yes gene_type:complete
MSSIVLFAVTWFMTFFVILPLRVVSQDEAGAVVPGTPAGAPAGYVVKKKAKQTTVVAIVIWVVLSGIIFSEAITVRDFDWAGRMGPTSTFGK